MQTRAAAATPWTDITRSLLCVGSRLFRRRRESMECKIKKRSTETYPKGFSLRWTNRKKENETRLFRGRLPDGRLVNVVSAFFHLIVHVKWFSDFGFGGYRSLSWCGALARTVPLDTMPTPHWRRKRQRRRPRNRAATSRVPFLIRPPLCDRIGR